MPGEIRGAVRLVVCDDSLRPGSSLRCASFEETRGPSLRCASFRMTASEVDDSGSSTQVSADSTALRTRLMRSCSIPSVSARSWTFGCREKTDIEANFERDDALEERLQRDALEDGRGKLRELAIGLDESVERISAVLDDGKAPLQIATHDCDGGWGDRRRGRSVGVRLGSIRRFREQTGAQGTGDGFDRGEGVADLVADDADEAAQGEALPRLAPPHRRHRPRDQQLHPDQIHRRFPAHPSAPETS